MTARSTWPTSTGSRSLNRRPWPRGTVVRALWGVTGRVARSAFVPSRNRGSGRLPDQAATRGSGESALLIQRRRYETGLHFIVSGDLDSVTACQLRWQSERLGPDAAATVLFDLADLTTIDKSGVDVLSAAYARLGERLVIIGGPALAHAIDLANVHDQLPIIEG